MIEQPARVVAIDGPYAWVEAERQSACGQCSAQAGCGTGVLARALGRRSVRLRTLNRVAAEVGDRVTVGIDEHVLLRGALLMYGLPLATMIAGAAWGLVLWGEPGSVLAGLAGLGVGFLAVRRRSRVVLDRRLPVILSRTSPTPGV
ncbi:MAG TPA: hypothetical protein ENK62_02295 [Chromatiales bacterium]|nr:hypothetical protein [Chromatiales bacterium]